MSNTIHLPRDECVPRNEDFLQRDDNGAIVHDEFIFYGNDRSEIYLVTTNDLYSPFGLTIYQWGKDDGLWDLCVREIPIGLHEILPRNMTEDEQREIRAVNLKAREKIAQRKGLEA